MKVIDLCPCFSFCCPNNSSETGPLSASFNGPIHGTYTVRRISSFGQTVIDEKGEECEIGRHCSIVQTYNGDTLPLSSKPTVVQPGVTDADLIERVSKMPTISESDLSPATKQKSRWKKALSTVKKKEFSPLRQKEKSSKNEIQLKHVKGLRKDIAGNHETSYSHDDILRAKKNASHVKGIDNVRRSSYLMAVPPPITVSSPDLVISDGVLAPRTIDISNSSTDLKTTDRSSPNLSSSWLKSQSMQDMNEGNRVESEREKLARLCGLDLALYEDSRTNIKKSNEALNRTVNSTLECVPDCWQEEPAGTVNFTAHYDQHSKQLHICINKIEGLCGEGVKREEYCGIVKLCVLPGKKQARLSKQLPQSLNPTVNQTFSFAVHDVTDRILRISLYNVDWQGTYDAVGHALFFIEDAVEQPTTHQMKLYNQSTADSTPGIMQISLGYRNGTFNISVIKVYKLLPKYRNCKLYIKVSYYYLSKKNKERVSLVCSCGNEDDAVIFNHACKFKIEKVVGGGERCFLVVSLKRRSDNYNVFKQDKTIGQVIFGPAYYSENGRKLTPWGRTVVNKEQLCYSFRMYL